MHGCGTVPEHVIRTNDPITFAPGAFGPFFGASNLVSLVSGRKILSVAYTCLGTMSCIMIPGDTTCDATRMLTECTNLTIESPEVS
jgi:hypothetical protein